MQAMSSITVLVSSPGRAIRTRCLDRLAGQAGIRVIGETRGGLETLAAVGMLRPRIVLIDLALVRVGRRSLIPALRQRHPGAKLILIGAPGGEAPAVEALCHGARGYVGLKALDTFLVKAVRAVDSGEAWVPRRMVAKLMDRLTRLYLDVGATGAYPAIATGTTS